MDYDFELIICLRDLLACLPNPVYLNLRCTPKQPTCAYMMSSFPPKVLSLVYGVFEKVDGETTVELRC